MKAWLSARELAGLPGMPASERRVRERAGREGWDFREVAAKGGPRGVQRQYSIHALPPATQGALARRERNTPRDGHGARDGAGRRDAPGRKDAPERMEGPTSPPLSSGRGAGGEALWATFERAPAGVRAEAERRLTIVQAVMEQQAAGLTREAAIAEVLASPLCARGGAGGGVRVTRRTLFRWLGRVRGLHRSDWLPALAPAHRGRTATAEVSPEAWEVFKADYLRLEAPGMAACYERLKRIAATRGWAVPSIAALRRRLHREVPVGARTLARHGTEALDRLYPAQARDRSVFHAMQAVNADGHKWDVFVRWPDGTVGRPVMVAWQDLHSGKVLAWRIGPTECAELVRLSFGDLVERWGIPALAYLDNGRGFASKWITGRMAWRHRFKVTAEEPEGLLTRLGVEVHWTTPYRGQSKPIERAFRDFCDHVAKHPAFSGAYTGNKPDAKPENYASRAVPLADFLRVVDSEIAAHNARPGRRSTVCAGRSFDQAFAESYAAATVRKASAEQRRLWLLAAEGVLAARPSGHVHLLGNRYWSEPLVGHAGRRVIVRFDPQALRAPVHVYRLDGAYIAAAECQAAAGFNDLQEARRHAKARSEFKRAQKAALAAERKLTAAEVAELVPEAEAPDVPAAGAIAPIFGQAAPEIEPEADEDEDARAAQFQRVVGLMERNFWGEDE